jgi:hypothetical protein
MNTVTCKDVPTRTVNVDRSLGQIQR